MILGDTPKTPFLGSVFGPLILGGFWGRGGLGRHWPEGGLLAPARGPARREWPRPHFRGSKNDPKKWCFYVFAPPQHQKTSKNHVFWVIFMVFDPFLDPFWAARGGLGRSRPEAGSVAPHSGEWRPRPLRPRLEGGPKSTQKVVFFMENGVIFDPVLATLGPL